MKSRSFAVRVLAMLTILVLSGSAVGCPRRAAAPAEQPAAPAFRAAAIFSIPDPARAGGWDRAQWAGLQLLKEEHGWGLSVAEAVPFPDLAKVASGYAEAGYDVVIFTSSAHIPAWMEVAPKYPDTWFLLMSVTDTLPASPRVAAWRPDMYSYGVIVGITAAKASKTGTIGVIGGMPIPALLLMFSGIIEGARHVRPDAEVLVSWAGNWVDVPTHRELTLLHIENQADVLFTVTGPATAGVFEAAEAKGAMVIGYAADWYDDAPGVVLTSVLVDTIRIYTDLAETFAAGLMDKRIVYCGPDYFTLADFRGKLPEATVAEIQDIVRKIQAGEVVIPVVMHDIGK
ncbi:MAG TPA: BMP family protein [Bacillota bacterium]|nr:BMP family protein [Bacillota bacterium]